MYTHNYTQRKIHIQTKFCWLNLIKSEIQLSQFPQSELHVTNTVITAIVATRSQMNDTLYILCSNEMHSKKVSTSLTTGFSLGTPGVTGVLVLAWAREASNGLLVSVWASDTRSCDVLAGGAGGGGGGVTCVFKRLCAKGFERSERALPSALGEASIPNCTIWARRNVFSFSRTVIWFCSILIALADFSASLAVAASCSFCSISSLTYSTVFSNTVPLLYTY